MIAKIGTRPYHWLMTIMLVLLTVASVWWSNRLGRSPTVGVVGSHQWPDSYMYRFNTLVMNQDGTLKSKLDADYLARYSAKDMTELINPKLVMMRSEQPTTITASKGRIMEDEDQLLLIGNTKLLRETDGGTLEIMTGDVRVSMRQGYAETDDQAVIIRPGVTTRAMGMRAYLEENRLQLLTDVHTTISP